jgi:hypothetical protein
LGTILGSILKAFWEPFGIKHFGYPPNSGFFVPGSPFCYYPPTSGVLGPVNHVDYPPNSGAIKPMIDLGLSTQPRRYQARDPFWTNH